MNALHSERLEFRPWTLDDVEGAFEMYGDPETMQYIGGNAVASLDDMHDALAALIERGKTHGPGLGAWCTLHDGQIVGTAILNRPRNRWGDPADDVQVGWHLARRHCGHGYATELGRRFLEYGFSTLGLPAIICLVEPPNVASKRVAERLRMLPMGRTNAYYEGVELDYYVSMPS